MRLRSRIARVCLVEYGQCCRNHGRGSLSAFYNRGGDQIIAILLFVLTIFCHGFLLSSFTICDQWTRKTTEFYSVVYFSFSVSLSSMNLFMK